MIQLHVLTRDPVPTTELASGLVLRDVDCSRLHGLVSERAEAGPPIPEQLLDHARLVGAVSRLMPALPVRFGVVHRGEDELREAIAVREGELLGALDRVGGHVEFVVRSADAPPDRDGVEITPNAGSGRAYLEQRLEQDRAAVALRSEVERRLDTVAEQLVGLAAAVMSADGRYGPEHCYLVPQSAADSFAARARTVVDSDPRLLVGGPWPPYTFAGRVYEA
jgi:hypothetical protein